MTRQEHIFLKLIEECAEVQQRVSKLLQFGADEKQKGQKFTNIERLRHEVNDVVAVIEILEEDALLPSMSRHERKTWRNKKRKRIEKYRTLSERRGKVC